MSGGAVHVIGAGIAGLSAAVRLVDAGRRGRRARGGAASRAAAAGPISIRRSASSIDNGNHLLLSGNHAALDYLDRIGSRATLTRSRRRRSSTSPISRAASAGGCDPNDGRVPWWLLDPKPARARRRRFGEYLAPLCVTLRAPANETVGEAMTCAGPLYERLWRPLLLAGLNTEPAGRLGARSPAAMLRETLFAGGKRLPSAGRGARPVAELRRAGARLPRGARRRRFASATACGRSRFDGERAVALDFDGGRSSRSATTTPS